MTVKSANGFGKPFCGVSVRLYRARVPESSRNDFRSSKHHFRVLPEVPVFLKYACFSVNSLGAHPVRIAVIFMLKFEFLKEKDVRYCLRSGCAECVLREPYAAEEIRFSSQFPRRNESSYLSIVPAEVISAMIPPGFSLSIDFAKK